jgi:MGT family glycosyltransferase
VSRFLFVVPPFVGHVNPTVGVAAALVERGHQVAWAGAASVVRPLIGDRGPVFDCAVPATLDAPRPVGLRGFAALEVLWRDVLVPLADAMVAGVAAAVDRFAPDVLVVDQQAMAGALVGDRTGLPWATSATTSAELTDPLAGLPRVARWLAKLMGELRQRHLGSSSGQDLRFSRRLVLAFSTEELVGKTELFDAPVRFVGPVLDGRPSAIEFPWQLLDPSRSLVLVTLGTANVDSGHRFLGECVTALRERADRLQAVVVDPAGALAVDDDLDVLVRLRIPQLALLAKASAVVCHAGHNTVCECLDNGLPSVLAPIRDDQPIIADQVVRAGAGTRLRFSKATAQHIGAAVDTVLNVPSYRDNANRIRESFRSAGGSTAAAAHLERLVE